MTAAVDTWPDGTPKKRAGFDRAAWDGEKPLAGHERDVDFDDIALASVVFERKPDTPDADYVPRGGTVIRKGRDEDTGRAWVDALNTRGRGGTMQVFVVRLWVDELGEHQPPTRRWGHGTARRICRAIGMPLDDQPFSAGEREQLLIAFGLVHEEYEL